MAAPDDADKALDDVSCPLPVFTNYTDANNVMTPQMAIDTGIAIAKNPVPPVDTVSEPGLVKTKLPKFNKIVAKSKEVPPARLVADYTKVCITAVVPRVLF